MSIFRLRLIIFALCFAVGFCSLSGQGIMVNEVGIAGNRFIELVVVGNECEYVDLRGWIIDDNNGIFTDCDKALAGTGVSTGHLRFSNSPTWSEVPPGTIIVIWDQSVGFPDEIFCLDYLMEVNVESNDSGSNPLFEINNSSPSISNTGDPCTNIDCNLNNGNTSYTSGSYMDLGMGSNYLSGLNSPIALSQSHDGIQIRTPNYFFYHGFAWGEGEHMPCTSSDPMMDGGPHNIPLARNDFYSFTNVVNDDYTNSVNFSSSSSGTPGKANSLENAQWILNQRFPLEREVTQNNCNTTLINNTTICIGDIFTFNLGNCTDNKYQWTSSNPTVASITGSAEQHVVEVESHTFGTTTLTVEISNDYPYLSSFDHGELKETYEINITVDGYDASFQLLDNPDICAGSCVDILTVDAPVGNYNIGFTMGTLSNDMNDIDVGEVIRVCLDEPGINPRYDDALRTFHLPISEVGSTMDLSMDFIQEVGATCNGVPATTPITFNLLPEVSTTTPTPLEACDQGGYAVFDLTTRNSEVASGLVIEWYEDITTNNLIVRPDSFTITGNAANVYALAIDGNCVSAPVQLDLTVSNAPSGHFAIKSTMPQQHCDGDGQVGEDVSFKVYAPTANTDYDTDIEILLDGGLQVMNQVIVDSFTVDLMGVRDSVIAYVPRAQTSGTCGQFTGTTDTFRFYNNYRPVAGRDTFVSQTSGIINLPSFFPASSSTGIFLREDNMSQSLGSTYSLSPGDSPHSILHVVSNLCGEDTARLDVFSLNCPSAGLDTTVIHCGDYQFRPQDLTRNANQVFYSLNGETVMPTEIIRVVAGTQLEILVEADTMMGCPLDTARLRVEAFPIPDAGLDVDLQYCGTNLDLESLVRETSQIGSFEYDDGTPITQTNLDLFAMPSGPYTIRHIVSSAHCDADTALFTLDLTPQNSAGRDTVRMNCGLGFLTPRDHLRDGIIGNVFYEGAPISPDFTLNFQGRDTIVVYNVIAAVGACPPDSAAYTVFNDKEPDAGLDVDSFVCVVGSYDLRDFLREADEEGYFSDFMGNDLASSIIDLSYGEEIFYRYIVDTRFCNEDRSTFRLRNYSLEEAEAILDNTLLCNMDTTSISFTFPFTGYHLYYTLVNNTTGSEYPRDKLFMTRTDTIGFVNAINSRETAYDLEPGNAYTVRIDSVLYEEDCVLFPDWGDLQFNTAAHVNFVLNPTLCFGETVQVADEVFDENRRSGTVIMPGMAANGCDSIVEVSLTYVNFMRGDYRGEICRGDTLILNGSAYYEGKLTGMDTLSNASAGGCDSIVSVSLTLIEPSTFVLERSFCDVDATVEVLGTTYGFDNPTGVEIIESGNSIGCDSIIEVNLTYLDPGIGRLDTSICNDDFVWNIQGENFDINTPFGQVVLPGVAANGCDSIIEVNVVFEELQIDYDVLPPTCPEDSIGSIRINEVGGSLPLMASFAEDSVDITSLPFTYDIPINSPTRMIIYDTNACGISFIDEVGAKPSLDYGIEDIEIRNNIYELSLSTNESVEYYEWYPDVGLSCINCPVTEVSLLGDQWVRLYAETNQGCIIEDSVLLRLDLDKTIFAPNVFSPNQDGQNDKWTVFTFNNLEVSILRVDIYDRWGKKVYALPPSAINNPDEGWDGAEHTSGVYVYHIEYENREGQNQSIIGDITLIR